MADDKGLPKVVRSTPEMRSRWGTGTVVVPAPREVDALMRTVPEGKVTTIANLCDALAARHGATRGCPLTTGIFAWIAAHAAAEAETATAGRPDAGTTPYWRTLKAGGLLNPKYPGGPEACARRLRAEGHQVVRRGQKFFVVDFEKSLFKPE